ncbi:response regulator transcription factor [Lentzea tibetensis]|uniref:Response regulator transcription factor n=1 Tax=Lentzea tibetensis TaxID=2591470 RepID=A0A563EJW0_9PSEU|nr:response regulator transcription factor [Lentzea tibetensis]TWP46966.1 response regulator transcription factor [Lentzea tibetensis]
MIKVAVVDGERLVRAGICSMLRTSERIDVVSETDDGRRAVELARRHRPDVMVMDVRVGGMDGIRATQVVQRELPATKVIILTAIAVEECVYRSFRAGASGFLVKDVGPQELVDAVLTVASGESVLSPAITRGVINQFLRFDRDRVGRARQQVESLTAREREVLAYVVKGVGNAEIARALYVSEGAVKAHVSHLLAKLRCTNRVQAAIKAHESGVFRELDESRV